MRPIQVRRLIIFIVVLLLAKKTKVAMTITKIAREYVRMKICSKAVSKMIPVRMKNYRAFHSISFGLVVRTGDSIASFEIDLVFQRLSFNIKPIIL